MRCALSETDKSALAQPWRSVAMANPVDNPTGRLALDLLRTLRRRHPHFRRADAGVPAGVHHGDRGDLPDGVSVAELRGSQRPNGNEIYDLFPRFDFHRTVAQNCALS